jgi:hypothetical protein
MDFDVLAAFAEAGPGRYEIVPSEGVDSRKTSQSQSQEVCYELIP